MLDEIKKREKLPFAPFDSPLRDVIRKGQLRSVAIWLMGKDENSILAQQSNSLWESSLSMLFLAELASAFGEDETDLKEKIKFKNKAVARWLLERKTQSSDKQFIYWEGVTWDTSVVIRAIAKALKCYNADFSEYERSEFKICIIQGISWLYHRFSKWDSEVKYPFGPADVAQILATLVTIRSDFPELYNDFLAINAKKDHEIEIEIVKYLLHAKTEKTLTIPISSEEDEEIVTYWWDDYFSTAEVVESIALFYREADVNLKKQDRGLMHSVKEALVRACCYFEQSQVDGMWGSHIDTIKVVYAYVRIRSLIPQSSRERREPLITPEIHTTFKAIRWMCDEKQIFSDGSFLHTMFLTVFYAHALLEVYKSWEPAHLPINLLYDDVVWFSPVRTTPERSKRLAAELHIEELKRSIDDLKLEICTFRDEKNEEIMKRLRWARATIAIFISLFLITLFGIYFNAFTLEIIWSTDKGLPVEYFALSLPLAITLVSLAWNWDNLFNRKNPTR